MVVLLPKDMGGDIDECLHTHTIHKGVYAIFLYFEGGLGLLYNYPNPFWEKEVSNHFVKINPRQGEVSGPWIASWKIDLFQLTWVGEWTVFGVNNS